MQKQIQADLIKFSDIEDEFNGVSLGLLIEKVLENKSNNNFVSLYVKIPNGYYSYSQNKDISYQNKHNENGGYFFNDYSCVIGGKVQWEFEEPYNALQYFRYKETYGNGLSESFESCRFHRDVLFLRIRIEDIVAVLNYGPADLCLFHYGFSKGENGVAVNAPVRLQWLYSVHPVDSDVISIMPTKEKRNSICVDVNSNVYLERNDIVFLKEQELLFSDVHNIGVLPDSPVKEIAILNALARKWRAEREGLKKKPYERYVKYFVSSFEDSFLCKSGRYLKKSGALNDQSDLYKSISRFVFESSRTAGSSKNAKRSQLNMSDLKELQLDILYAGDRLVILNKMGMDRVGVYNDLRNAKSLAIHDAMKYGLEEEEATLLAQVAFEGALINSWGQSELHVLHERK